MSPNNNCDDFEEIPRSEVPDWLTEKFFNEIVENELKIEKGSYFEVIIKSIKPAVKKGDNFMSIMYRVKIEIKLENNQIEEMFLIIKALLDVIPEIKELGVFDKEIRVYGSVLPALEQEFSDLGESVHFGPKCLKVTSDPTDLMVLEDLNHRGYKMANRLIGLDMDHTKLFIEKLAKFHASSAVRFEKYGQFGGKLDQSIFVEEQKEFFEAFMTGALVHFIEALENWEFGKNYVEKIKNWKTKCFPELVSMFLPNSEEFRCLNHGDAWTNNYLFSYDENDKPNDILFIDFQVTFIAPPILDLYYFFISSTNNEIKENEFDTLIQYYHENLTMNLKKLNYQKQIPTLKELHIDLLRKGFYGAFCTTGILAIVLLESTEEASMATFMKTDEDGIAFKRKIYNNPRFLRAMEILLPFLDKRGLLDL